MRCQSPCCFVSVLYLQRQRTLQQEARRSLEALGIIPSPPANRQFRWCNTVLCFMTCTDTALHYDGFCPGGARGAAGGASQSGGAQQQHSSTLQSTCRWCNAAFTLHLIINS